MLRDKFFLWPYPGVSLRLAIDEITPVLAKSGLAKWLDPALGTGNLAEFIALECRSWNINPWWLLVRAQAEQGAILNPNLRASAINAWLGVVGQDLGRTSNPGYYGVYMQVSRFCEVTAWLLGVEDAKKWPEYYRTKKEAQRYQLGRKLTIERDGKPFDYTPLSRGEYLQLAYTPHWHVLEGKVSNETLARTTVIVPPQYL